MRRGGVIPWLALAIATLAFLVAILGISDRPQTGLQGPTGPQGIQGPRGADGKDGTQTIVYRDRACPRYELPAVPKEGADYALRFVKGGRCPVYRFVPVYGKDP